MIKLNEDNFALKIQEVIERFYLQPLDGSVKENLKDSLITRPIHGAMHASRATLWAIVMDELLRKLVPEFVNDAYGQIAAYLNTEKKTVSLLVYITTTCHDSARKGEGQDLWEAESAENTQKFLESLGLPKAHAQVFAYAIKWKDEPEKYRHQLLELGVEEDALDAFDYIRKLVNLGDNLDIMRCVRSFELSFIFNTLNSIPEFDASKHYEVIISLVKSMHQMIYDQYDMRYGCRVLDLNYAPIFEHPPSHTPFRKLKYEHAANTFAAVVKEVFNYSEIKALVPASILKWANELAESPDFFDPFIHGTTSATLALLTKTEFQLMPTLKMLDTYHAAPMVGELTQGGYSILGMKKINEEDVGAISYGNVLSGSYNLKKITSNYTTFKSLTIKEALDDFRDSFTRGLSQGFSNLNLLLIYFTRARQLQLPLKKIISETELAELNNQLAATIQFYYFLQLLGTYIFPDFAAIDEALSSSKILTSRDIADAVYSILNIEFLVNNIIRHNINLKEILANPNEENLGRALKIMELPATVRIKSGFFSENKVIDLPITQFLGLQQPIEDYKSKYDPKQFGYFSRNSSNYCINLFLENYVNKNQDSGFFIGLGQVAKDYVVALEDRVRLFNDLVRAPQEQFSLTQDQRTLIQKNYPVILMSESVHIKPFGDEYRNVNPMKMGEDIRIIATDTAAHQKQLMHFVHRQQLNPVQVILIDDLKKAGIDKRYLPKSIDTPHLRTLLTQTKTAPQKELFFKLYTLLDELNYKRNKFQPGTPAFFALDRFLDNVQKEIATAFPLEQPLSEAKIREFCQKSIQLIDEQKVELQKHRGILGVVDKILTVLASLIVFYPAVYLYQRHHKIQHTFFNTETGGKAAQARATLGQISDQTDNFSAEEEQRLEFI